MGQGKTSREGCYGYVYFHEHVFFNPVITESGINLEDDRSYS